MNRSVLDTSVIVKSIFKPPKTQSSGIYKRDSSSLLKILAYRYVEQNQPFSIIPSTISLASLFVITPPSSKEKIR